MITRDLYGLLGTTGRLQDGSSLSSYEVFLKYHSKLRPLNPILSELSLPAAFRLLVDRFEGLRYNLPSEILVLHNQYNEAVTNYISAENARLKTQGRMTLDTLKRLKSYGKVESIH